jgi:hypothetical protein
MPEKATQLPRLPAAQLESYYQAVRAAFERAAAASGINEKTLWLGRHSVRIRAAGRGLLAELTAALAHHSLAMETKADLTIHIWDSEVTGAAGPPSPLAWHARHSEAGEASFAPNSRFESHGELPAFNEGNIRSSFHVFPSMLRLLHRERDEGFFWIDSAAHLPYYENYSPFHRLFSWWMTERQGLVMHAAAVGGESGGVLLVGDAGAGKSSTALACLGSSLSHAADDYCLVESEPQPYVYSLYNTAKLKTSADVEQFPQLAALVHNPGRLESEKALMFLHLGREENLSSGFPLRAILLPRVTGVSAARLAPVSPAETLRAMAPSTLLQLPNNGPGDFQLMAELARKLPSFVLEVGPDRGSIPSAIEHILSTFEA